MFQYPIEYLIMRFLESLRTASSNILQHRIALPSARAIGWLTWSRVVYTFVLSCAPDLLECLKSAQSALRKQSCLAAVRNTTVTIESCKAYTFYFHAFPIARMRSKLVGIAGGATDLDVTWRSVVHQLWSVLISNLKCRRFTNNNANVTSVSFFQGSFDKRFSSGALLNIRIKNLGDISLW